MTERVPKVRIAKPAGRPFQLRYTDRVTGREVRLSTGSHKTKDADLEKRKLEARLLLGTEIPRRRRIRPGPGMAWESFMELYRNRHLRQLRKRSRDSYESRLDLAASKIGPRLLEDMARREALVELRDWRLSKTSPHYAKSFMSAVFAALHWAEAEGLLPGGVPRIPRIKASKLSRMKGRPLAGEEFERMLEKVPGVVGEAAAASYRHVLRGLWSSALRIGELMAVSWDIPETITPVWRKGRQPVLVIPAALQKNETEEEIPLLPWFEKVLLETRARDRTGWVFNPWSLNPRLKRKARVDRPSSDWVARVISRIGEKAAIVVSSKGGRKKYASAHDLRRSCAERLLDAGIPQGVIQRILRHESWETTKRHYAPGSVQADARLLREALSGSR